MGVRIAWLTEQQGWVGCGGFLHAMLPTHLNSHRKSSGRTLKIVVECAIFANGQNIISSEIRGVLNLVFIVVKESGGKNMVFLLLCSVPEVLCLSRDIGNTQNLVHSAFSQMEQNYHSEISVAVPGINCLSY